MLAVIVDEARKHDLDVMVHAVTAPAMLAAIEAGAAKLVHTPHDSFLTNEQAKLVAAAGIENLSTVGFAVPLFEVFNHDNVPTFRDGSPWPSGILGTGSNAAGEKPVNARTLWDNGVVYGFGTDTNYLPLDGLYHELKSLNLMFSPRDIVKLMGPNTCGLHRDDGRPGADRARQDRRSHDRRRRSAETDLQPHERRRRGAGRQDRRRSSLRFAWATISARG